ncbi:MAG TPA: nuclear transport factor 2 family protein [Egibacteraceae bacterium]|nr:nuclear transport factor 2 family protein [Egibacteraceae bacterium]
MSHEDVEIVRRATGAFNRGDFGLVAELCDDDLEFVSVMTAVQETTYRGRDTWERYAADMRETWAEWRLEDLRLLDAGDHTVTVLMRLVGAGKRSGVPVDREIGVVYRLRDGRLWRVRSYPDARLALEAAGLSEQRARGS